jgi:putative copper resistance protein D
VQISVWDIAAAVDKAVLYAATFGAAGSVFFLFYCRAYLRDPPHRLIRRLTGLLVLLAVGCSLVRIPLLAASMSGSAAGMLDSHLASLIWRSGEGRSCGIRLIGVMLAGLAALFRSRPNIVSIVGATIAATSFAWTGHAQALRPSWAPVILIGIHLLGIAFWVGALPPLLLVARGPDHLCIAASARRFGRLAVIVVAMIVLVGVCVLWRLLGNVSELWSGAYGRAFTLKIAFVSVLLAVAAFNKLHLTPRLVANEPLAVSTLRRSLVFEMIIAAAILLISATLTTLLGPPTLQ